MLLRLDVDPRDHSACAIAYNEAEGWIESIWYGYVDQAEAMRGAQAYLQRALTQPNAFLLNDNSRLTDPWFKSLDWLADVWVP